MAIKTPQQYIESLKDGRVVFCNGERVKDVTKHPILKICRDWMAMDYVLENDSRYRDLITEKNEEGDRVSFALMPQRSKKDLIRLREIVKLWARVCLGKPPGAKFVAKDGLNALTVVSQRIDRKYGTNYAERVEAYRKHMQKNDLAFAMGLTDVKGGGIALGHPIGNTGCRLVVSLIHEMEKRGLKLGLAALCGGSGHGQAIIIEKT